MAAFLFIILNESYTATILSKFSGLEAMHFSAQASLVPEFIKEVCEWDAKDRGVLRVITKQYTFKG